MIKRFRLQYASNLFVESWNKPFESLLRPAAGSLALCGNIGRIRHPKTLEFLHYCSQQWDKVYWILGPHDVSVADPKEPESCYDLAAEAVNTTNQMNNDGNGHLQVLCGSEHWIQSLNIVLIGATLWHMPTAAGYPLVFEPTADGHLQPVSAKTMTKWHKEDYDYMYMRRRFWMISEPDISIVYLSHHLPSAHLINRRIVDTDGTQCLREVSPLNTKNMTAPVDAWIAGASGSCSNGVLPGKDGHPILCGVNGLRRYPFHAANEPHPGYRPDMVVDIRSRGPPAVRQHAPVQYLPPVLTSLFRPKPIPALA